MDTQHTSATMPAIGPFYTTRQAATMLNVCQRLVQEWVRTGQLRAAHYGTAWRISHTDLQAFVAAASAPTPPEPAAE
jgi:excisionase family DNA binding protein